MKEGRSEFNWNAASLANRAVTRSARELSKASVCCGTHSLVRNSRGISVSTASKHVLDDVREGSTLDHDKWISRELIAPTMTNMIQSMGSLINKEAQGAEFV